MASMLKLNPLGDIQIGLKVEILYGELKRDPKSYSAFRRRI